MATPSSRSPASKTGDAAARRRKQNIIGAVTGAVIGGVLGAFAVKKVRDGSARRLVPAKVPVAARRAAGAVKGFAQEAKLAAKATAASAADAALQQVTNSAAQFVADTVTGQNRRGPGAVAAKPEAEEAKTSTATSQEAAAGREDAASREKPAVVSASKVGARKKPAARKKPRARGTRAE